MFMKIAGGIADTPKFRYYTYKEEMISEAITIMCTYAGKFDENKSKNPFAYFSQVASNACIKIINSERKHQTIRDVFMIQEENSKTFFMSEKRQKHVNEYINSEK